MSDLDVMFADAAEADAAMRGQTAVFYPQSGGSVTLSNVIVLNDPLAIRATLGNKALEYPLIVQIPKSSFPGQNLDVSGAGNGVPVVKGDQIGVMLRSTDTGYTKAKIGALLAQTNGMWTFGLD